MIALEDLPRTDLTQRDVNVLSRLARDLGDKSVAVEIGSYLGASSICLARSVRGGGGTLFCIDTWTNAAMSEGPRDTYSEFLHNTRDLHEIIRPVRCTSVDAVSRVDADVDLLFIDGDHSPEGCRRDLVGWLPKVREGGLVVLHDFNWADGVREAIRDHLFPYQDGGGHWEGNLYWARVRRRRTPSDPGTGPLRPSVIFSTRGDGIALDWRPGVAGQRCEVLVVQTGRGESMEAARPHAPTDARGATVYVEPVQGLLAGRHRGASEASGEILFFVDDDVRLPAGWLEAMLEPFADPTVHLAGCRYLPEYEVQPPDWLEQFWSRNGAGRRLGYLSLSDHGTETTETDPTAIWGLCYAIRRDTLFKLGGFHPDAYPWELRRYRGDGETGPSALARQLKLKAIHQGKTCVYHRIPASRLTVEYFERRAYLQGISDSYASIRRAAEIPAERTVQDWLHATKSWFKTALRRTTARESLTARVRRAYRRGYRYHQAEVRADPDLHAWVLKDDYWDYRLPAGWETHVTSRNEPSAAHR